MKPILFNTEMVRAILHGRKTMTRKVVKPQPKCSIVPDQKGRNPLAWWVDNERWIKTPYRPGDILYVRETWNGIRFGNGSTVPFQTQYWYKADDTSQNPDDKWRPSIHMPREAARIFLRVTDVRVERLQKMEIADFKAEGIICRRPKGLPGSGCDCVWKHDGCLKSPCANRDAYEYLCWREPFSELWDSTIKLADRALYGWEANPWVWVIEFERISKEVAAHG